MAKNNILLSNSESVGRMATHFRHWEKVFCHFIVDPHIAAKILKFKWINPLGQEEQSYLHLIDKRRESEYVAHSWITIDAPLFSKAFGSKYFGKWRVEVFLDDKRVAEEWFIVD